MAVPWGYTRSSSSRSSGSSSSRSSRSRSSRPQQRVPERDDEGITRSRVRQIIACHPGGERCALCTTVDEPDGPFNISQIRVTFSRNRFPEWPLRCYTARNSGCKIFFITRGDARITVYTIYRQCTVHRCAHLCFHFPVSRIGFSADPSSAYTL